MTCNCNCGDDHMEGCDGEVEEFVELEANAEEGNLKWGYFFLDILTKDFVKVKAERRMAIKRLAAQHLQTMLEDLAFIVAEEEIEIDEDDFNEAVAQLREEESEPFGD